MNIGYLRGLGACHIYKEVEVTARDGLTGLMTRHAFEGRFESAIKKAAEKDEPLTLLLLDLDDFKKFNDSYGHTTGDDAIVAFARIVTECLEKHHMAVRYGGEEIAVLLPATEREAGILIAERIRAAMDRPMDFGEVNAKLTVSIGIAAYPVDGETEHDLLRNADHALYRAKKTGRNRFCLAQQTKMATKTNHYRTVQLERLTLLSKREGLGEAVLLRQALDDLLFKFGISKIET